MLLSIGHWIPDMKSTDSVNCIKAAGWIGLICGCSAFYLGAAELLNESIGFVILPIGDPKAHESDFLSNWVRLLSGRSAAPAAAQHLPVVIKAQPPMLAQAPPASNPPNCADSASGVGITKAAPAPAALEMHVGSA